MERIISKTVTYTLENEDKDMCVFVDSHESGLQYTVQVDRANITLSLSELKNLNELISNVIEEYK